jgi:hypothetical protein
LESGADQQGNNQKIDDTKDAQTLSQTEIEAMKEAETGSAEIIRAIVKNCKRCVASNSTFSCYL